MNINIIQFVIVYSIIIVAMETAPDLDEVECGSYVDYVAIDPPYSRYKPYYVKLHRCHGANKSPRRYACLPTKIEKIQIPAVNLLTHEFENITVKNYTQCKEFCKLTKSNCTDFEVYDERECTCKCNYSGTQATNLCVAPFHWSRSRCRCVSTCDNVKKVNISIQTLVGVYATQVKGSCVKRTTFT